MTTDDFDWKAGPTPEQGAPKVRMYRGRTATYYGVAFRRVGGRIERERCCGAGHVKRARAIECAERLVRSLRRERGE